MKTLLVLPMLTALLACKPVGTTYVRPKTSLPEHYAMSPESKPGHGVATPEDWWTSLGDPRLDGLIQQALRRNPDLEIAQASLRQVRAIQGVQEAQGGPTLGLGAKVSRDHLSKNSEQMANIPFKNVQTDFTNYQVGFDASWELDFFGHQRRLAEAAQARSEASQERLKDIQLMVAAEVTRNFIELRTWQGRLKLASENLQLLDEQVRIAHIAHSAGDMSALDLQAYELNRSVYQASLANLRLGLRQSQNALATLTGTTVEEIQNQVGETQPLPALAPLPAAGVPSDLLQHRPDLRVAERELAASKADVGVAISNLYPRISLVGSGGWTSIQSGTLLQNASRMWSLGPQLSLPLFNKGLLKNQVRANEAASDVALANYHKAVLNALADVDVAFTRVAQSEERKQQLVNGETRQEQVVAFTEKQFKAGEVSRLPLLQARRTLLDQQDQVLQAQSQSLIALVSTYKALGGGWNH